MNFIDKKFKNNKKQYILQCLMATLALLVVLLYVVFFSQTSIIASIGATSFIVFSMPHRERSRAKYILGSYILSAVIGGICSIFIDTSPYITPSILAAISVGICMFLMTILNLEHPPAVGFALGISIDGFEFRTIFFVLIIIVLLIFIKNLIKEWIIDLL